MTFSATYDPVIYAGNGISTRFSTLWPFADTTHVRVEEIDADGVATPLVFGTDYTVEETDERRGTVVATTAPAADVSWRISRRTPLLVGRDGVPDVVPPPYAAEYILACGDGGQVARTSDRGVTWESVSIPNPDDMLGIATDGTSWVAVGDQTFWRTTNDGDTWTEITPPSQGAGTSFTWHCICSPSANVYVAGGTYSQSTFPFTTLGCLIYRSDDGGLTFTEVAQTLDDASVRSIATDGAGNLMVALGVVTSFSVGTTHRARSEDNGLTWALTEEPTGGANPRPWRVSYVNGQWVFGLIKVIDGALVYSATGTDGTWTTAVLPSSLGSTAEVVYDGTYYWGNDYTGRGHMRWTNLNAQPDYNPEYAISGQYLDLLDLVSIGGVTIFVGGRNVGDPAWNGLYTSEGGEFALTPRVPPVGHVEAYRSIAIRTA